MLSSQSVPKAVLEIISGLKRAGHQAFLVGGSVRDLRLDRPVKDYDVATSARAEQVQGLFRRVIPTGLRHGTVTVMNRGMAVEVTTFRSEEGYSDARRPDRVVFHEDIVADLARRDFTINAMAFDPTGPTFVDPFEGTQDLERRLIRCVGEPRLRFGEDGLRPLRAVRLASVLGFDIDPSVLEAIPATLGSFDRIAGERVREELTKLLTGSLPSRGMRWLGETGLLERILPEADLSSESLDHLDALPAEFEPRLAALLASRGAPLPASLERLKLSRKSTDEVALLVRESGFARTDFPDDAALRRALGRIGREWIEEVLSFTRAPPELVARVDHVLASNSPLSIGELALRGEDIIALTGATGAGVGKALRELLEAVYDDPGLNTPEQLAAVLQKRR